MAKKLQYGCTWINTHFMLVNEMPHGGLKSSGYGKDLGLYALENYTVPRHVMIKFCQPSTRGSAAPMAIAQQRQNLKSSRPNRHDPPRQVAAASAASGGGLSS